jgi:hypothetical protein
MDSADAPSLVGFAFDVFSADLFARLGRTVEAAI